MNELAKEKSYGKNIIKIYLWQFLSFISNFLSFFVLIPRLSLNERIYGIYSICISVNFFLQYADLGLVNVGLKFSSEYFIQEKHEEENKIIGMICFLLSWLVIILTIAFGILAINPNLLINELTPEEFHTASTLLWILTAFAPFTILQKFIIIKLGTRLEDYVYNRIFLISNLLRILSGLLFFSESHYDIIGFFLTFQLLSVLPLISSIIYIKRRYNFKIKEFFINLKFSKEMYEKIKSLFFVSIYSTVIWVLFFELDIIFIAKNFNAQNVAYFSIALTLFNFFRTALGIIFSPFNARFNYFIGLNDVDGLNKYYEKLTFFIKPLLIIPMISLILFMRPLIFTWVGFNFESSIMPAILLILGYYGHFISMPASIVLVAKKKTNIIAILGTLQILIFWVGIALTYKSIGFISVSLFKMISFYITFIYYLYFSFKDLKIPIKGYIIEGLFIWSCIIVVILSSTFLASYINLEKSIINLFIVMIIVGILSVLGLGIYLILSKKYRQLFKEILAEFLKNSFKN